MVMDSPASATRLDALTSSTAVLRRRNVAVGDMSIHVVEAGAAGAPAFLFLHGWPQSSYAFRSVMEHLRDAFHVVAIDLPGVGGSLGAPESGDKQALSAVVEQVVETLAIKNLVLVGHDVGGQIAFAALRRFGQRLSGAVIASVAIPGLKPWFDVVRNPHIWHFAFHAVPQLPELLVTGHIGAYFDFFYDAIAARPDAITPEARATYVEAYTRPEALKAGFDWYRGFGRDEADNEAVIRVDTPVLCLRGGHDPGDLAVYVEGLRQSGLSSVVGGTIEGAGHFTPEENPQAFAARLAAFHPSVR